MERRSFLAATAGAAAALVANTSAVWAKAKPKKPANAIAKVTAFKVGVPRAMSSTFKGAQRNIIVHRLAATRFIVLDPTCTHQGCQVRVVDQSAQCPCHLAMFNLADGTNSTPPSGSEQVLPLRRYGTAIKKGYLVFTS